MMKRGNDILEHSLIVAFYDTIGAWDGMKCGEFRAFRRTLMYFVLARRCYIEVLSTDFGERHGHFR